MPCPGLAWPDPAQGTTRISPALESSHSLFISPFSPRPGDVQSDFSPAIQHRPYPTAEWRLPRLCRRGGHGAQGSSICTLKVQSRRQSFSSCHRQSSMSTLRARLACHLHSGSRAATDMNKVPPMHPHTDPYSTEASQCRIQPSLCPGAPAPSGVPAYAPRITHHAPYHWPAIHVPKRSHC
jgi:hypothetical protein